MGKKIWTAQARFDAIAPALSYALESQDVRERWKSFDIMTQSDPQLHTEIQKAADASGASYDDVQRWIENFIAFGRPGLLTQATVVASDCPAALVGTWEMAGRWFNGQEVAASSTIYYDSDPGGDPTLGWRLITMYAEENHFINRPEEGPYFLAAYGPLKYTQVDPYEIQLDAQEEIISTQGTGDGVTVRMQATLRSFGGNNTPMVVATGFDIPGNPVRFFGDDVTYNYQVVKIEGIGDSLEFRSTGLSTYDGKQDTFDNYDLYHRTSSDKPLISGLWTIHEFWDIMKDPGSQSKAIKALGGRRNPHMLWGKKGSVGELHAYAKKA